MLTLYDMFTDLRDELEKQGLQADDVRGVTFRKRQVSIVEVTVQALRRLERDGGALAAARPEGLHLVRNGVCFLANAEDM